MFNSFLSIYKFILHFDCFSLKGVGSVFLTGYKLWVHMFIMMSPLFMANLTSARGSYGNGGFHVPF